MRHGSRPQSPSSPNRYAGEASFGLTAEERKRIVQMVSSTKGHVRIDVSAHGEPGGPLRDAIMLRVVS